MPYQLVLSEPDNSSTKDAVAGVFFDNLPYDYKVYALYYPSFTPNNDLEEGLIDLGNITGKNLYVNIGKLNDPKFDKIVAKFRITSYPVIIITAISELAAIPAEVSTAYVKIDNKRLLNSPAHAIECVQTIFTLFLKGEIASALRQVKKNEYGIVMVELKNIMMGKLDGIREFLEGSDIGISIMEGKFELKHS